MPVSDVVPAPSCVSDPAPLTAPAKTIESDRLNASTLLLITSPDDAAGRAPVTNLQGPRADRRPAGVGVGAGQRRRARPELGERADAADHTAEGDCVGSIEGQRTIVCNIADAMLPVVPPSPICSVPALIVVPPV